jgi:hypothetical protein
LKSARERFGSDVVIEEEFLGMWTQAKLINLV